MMKNPRGIHGLLLCLGILGAPVAAPLSAEQLRHHFDADSAARPPGFFDSAVLTGTAPARS